MAVALSDWRGAIDCGGFGVAFFLAAGLLGFFAAFLMTFFVTFFTTFFVEAFFTVFLVAAFFAGAFFAAVFFLAIGFLLVVRKHNGCRIKPLLLLGIAPPNSAAPRRHFEPPSTVWTGEYEIFEWDLGSTFNYSEIAALIAPRPFMVERGHFDGVDERVASEYAKVQRIYNVQLKMPERCEIEYFVGPHKINGVGTYEFLHKHLRWPKPQ